MHQLLWVRILFPPLAGHTSPHLTAPRLGLTSRCCPSILPHCTYMSFAIPRTSFPDHEIEPLIRATWPASAHPLSSRLTQHATRV
ncbi:hypothetical protein EDD21DRAFT_370894 [Dissophora ornata]|nr:hypothetical protein EDD21DRAFT_370894 [Dissophora ornata]